MSNDGGWSNGAVLVEKTIYLKKFYFFKIFKNLKEMMLR